MNKITLSLLVFAVIGVLGVGLISAHGLGNDMGFGKYGLTEEEKSDLLQEKEVLREAIENQNYQTWRSLMEERLTEENFNKLVEKHEKMSEFKGLKEELRQAWKDEDFERVKEIKDEMTEIMPEKPEHLEGKEFPNKREIKKHFWSGFKFWGK